MEIKNLQTFSEIVKSGSFNKAAAKLGYTQSTVSFQIKQLEQELNCRLFDRIGKKVILTDQGKLLLDHVNILNKDINNMIQDFSETEESIGQVHMFSSDSICEKMMMENYHDFYSKYPKIKLIFSTGDTVDLLKVLDTNEADVIFTLDNHIFNPNYVIARESPVKMVFVTNADHPLAGRSGLSIRNLLDYPFLLTEKGMSYRKLLDQQLAEMSISLNPVLETGRTDIIVKSVRKGQAICFLPYFVVRDYVEDGQMVCLDVTDLEITIWKQLIYHKDKWISKPLSDFIEYVMAHEFDW